MLILLYALLIIILLYFIVKGAIIMLNPISKIFNIMNNPYVEYFSWPYLSCGALNMFNIAMPDFASIYWVKIVEPGPLIITSKNKWWWDKIMSSNPEFSFLSLSLYNSKGMPLQTIDFSQEHLFWKASHIHVKLEVKQKSALLFRIYSSALSEKTPEQINATLQTYHQNLPIITSNNKTLKPLSLENIFQKSNDLSVKATAGLSKVMKRMHKGKCEATQWTIMRSNDSDAGGLFPNHAATYIFKCIVPNLYTLTINLNSLNRIVSNNNVRYVGVMLCDSSDTSTKQAYSLYFYDHEIKNKTITFDARKLKIPIIVIREIAINESSLHIDTPTIPKEYLDLVRFL